MADPSNSYYRASDTEVGEKAPFLLELPINLDNEFARPITDRSSRRSRCSFRGLVVLLIATNILLAVSHIPKFFSFFFHSSSLPALYSPAESLARTLTLRKFNPAFGVGGREGIYVQEPSAEVDAAWQALYYPVQLIDEQEAHRLPNKTVPVSAEPGAGYLVGLSVFHDLHCLDSIRKALWVGSDPATGASSYHLRKRGDIHETYESEHHDVKHLMHCINNLRESLMCHVDTTSVSWQWSPAEKGLRVFSDVTHKCRDFDAVLKWGREHAWRGNIETQKWANGQPPEVGTCGVADPGCGWD